jgi:hypothetical protein
MRPNRSLARGYLATLAFALAAAVACSGRDRADGANGDGFKPPVEGAPCEPGQVRDCGIEIGRNGSVVDCAKGTQTCTADKTWGTCIANGTTFKAAAPATKSLPEPGLGTNAVGGSSTTCADNPCNPYCQTFNDAPDTGVSSDAVTTVIPGESITIDKSNVPGGFQNKGTLDSQCASTPGSLAYREACQFDMHCGTKSDGSVGCVPFVTAERNACAGVDITAPPVCVPTDTSTWRNLTVCNRGSVDLTENIQCMGYPGNSPQFPDDNPGAGRVVLQTGSTVDPTTGTTNPITATNPLKAGECRTYRVPNSNFLSSGTESIMCNPPSSATPVTTTLLTLPTSAETVDFATPNNALSDTDSLASATTNFQYQAVSPAVYATGYANNVAFTSPASLTGAPDATGARGTLTASVATAAVIPSVAYSDYGPWTASSGSTIKDDLTAVDTKSSSVTLGPGSLSWIHTEGYSFPGATGVITHLDVTLDATYTNFGPDFIRGRIYIQKGSTYLTEQWINSGTLSIALPYGSLLATEVGSLIIWVDAVTGTGFSGTQTMTANHLAVAARYNTPVASATIDATGYAWAAPPAGTYTGLEFTGTFRSTNKKGVVYAYAKNSAGTTIASTVFALPSGYTANTWTTATQLVPVTGLTAADLTAGLTVHLEAFPDTTAALEVDSVGLRPVYRSGSDTRTIRFKGFGLLVPAGATNVRLAAIGNYKIDPLLTGDQITGSVLSISGSTTTLISTSSATITNNAFNFYQLGYQTIADPTTIEDPKLTVDVAVKKGSGNPTTLGTSVGSLDSLGVRLQYDATVAGSVAECNPSNNWTVNKANPSTICDPVTLTTYPPWTVSRVFQATCPSGYRPKWKYAGYTSTTPTGTKIEFRFRGFDGTATSTGSTTCNPLTPVTTSPPTPLATAQLSPDTQVCSLTAAPTATCPVDLATGLGATDALKECLQMDAYGIAATTPPASPTLTDWRVTYDCLPME